VSFFLKAVLRIWDVLVPDPDLKIMSSWVRIPTIRERILKKRKDNVTKKCTGSGKRFISDPGDEKQPYPISRSAILLGKVPQIMDPNVGRVGRFSLPVLYRYR
jgi:hypothetical protein